MIDPSILSEARDEASLVQVRTRYSDQPQSCFPIEVERDLVLFLTLDAGFHLDGMRVLRPRDLVECTSPHPHAKFVEEALRLRGEDEIELPALSIESMVTLLETSIQHLPVVGFYRDEIEPGVSRQGRVMEVDEQRALVLEVDDDALWASEPTIMKIEDLTRVDLGGARLEAFYLVAGEPD